VVGDRLVVALAHVSRHPGEVSSLVDACGPEPCSVALAELAARQHGVVTAGQLRALGLGARGVSHRVARGRLHRVHRGVYAVGHPLLTPDGRRMAAVLACGEGAVLSHRSAAAAWGVRPTDRADHEVSTMRRGPGSRPGIDVHRVRVLAPADTAVVRGVPITSVARTLVDLAGVLAPHALDRAVHQAEVLRLLDARAVHDAMDRVPKRRGIATLRAALARPSAGVTRSRLEERFLALRDRAGLPRPRLNAHLPLGDRLVEVDALWRRERVVVELDGAAVHRTARAFEEDRRRDAALAALDHLVVRLTWRRLGAEPNAVLRELRTILALRA
jgi:very-short-patch-repair endonuclease